MVIYLSTDSFLQAQLFKWKSVKIIVAASKRDVKFMLVMANVVQVVKYESEDPK